MSLYDFDVQKIRIYGGFGEFSVGVGPLKIRAKYLLTKLRPGQQGSWENQLASQMRPWREIFQIDELSFEELIQRDLDDSRVAHDMIPYLLGDTGHNARFFPPVLAVLVPRKLGKSGIQPRYPTKSAEGDKESFGELFDFDVVKFGEKATPLGQIGYNPQSAAMVIVDGQHRAMAVLALHRQLNKSWGSDPFAPYYTHIDVTPEAVEHIELPVCLIYFPDLTEDEQKFKDAGIDLITICREIFTVVNKSAKSVSKSRELLLNDEDLPAYMMRRTLSGLKDRESDAIDSAKIYSFAYGDDENGGVSQVMAGQLEYCSAVAVHKMHAAAGFALPACFSLVSTSDVTDGRFTRNSQRPVDILAGSPEVAGLHSIGRKTGKSHSPAVLDNLIKRIGSITDRIVFPLFDRLRPFAAHNSAMRDLREALNDSNAIADPIQSKCRALLFDGSGSRSVFEEHHQRLGEQKLELSELGKPLPPHLEAQINYCESVKRALHKHEEELKLSRACKLFGIDKAGFIARDPSVVEGDLKVLRARAKSIFDATSTQAFQIGYLMAVLSAVERVLPSSSTFDARAKLTEFVSELYISGLNSFFGIPGTRHRTLSGYVAEDRAKAFDGSETGFRGLLASTNVRELNEKQWVFFRYVIFEIVHGRAASSAVLSVLDDARWSDQSARYRAELPAILEDIATLRSEYFESASRAAVMSADFRREVDLQEAKAKVEGKSDADILQLIEEAVSSKKASSIELSKAHLAASLGKLESNAQIIRRLGALAGTSTTEAPSSHGEAGEQEACANEMLSADEVPTSSANVDVVIVAEELLTRPPQEQS